MDLVEDKLWIGILFIYFLIYISRVINYRLSGGIDSALNTELLRQHGIYHVVTVDIQPLPFVDGFTYLFIRGVLSFHKI
jgi:hypothetical protein